MSKHIQICKYFDSNTMLKQDAINGARFFKDETLEYCVLGESLSKKDFILGLDLYIYILDWTGVIKRKININKFFNNQLEGYEIKNIKEIYKGVYIFILTLLNKQHWADKGLLYLYNSNEDSLKLISNIPEIRLDHHSFIIDNNDISHYYAISFKNADNPVILEVKKDKIIWSFNIWDNKSLWENLLIRGDGPHINSIAELDDNHLLVSFRNLGIVCLNKKSNKFDWVIGQKRNDLGFNDLPCLQHDIQFLDEDNSIFSIFNNNWIFSGTFIDVVLTRGYLDRSEFDQLKNSQIIIYNLKDCSSRAFDLNILSSLREGNAIKLTDSIYDINYGATLLYNKSNDVLYKLGLFEEKNINNLKSNMQIKFMKQFYRIARGL